ncbi:MAG: DNA primase [Candidatus Dormibacteraeota bacterium]|nr:DNA primase [Candidatus Dormibacteraeota bacterium]MBV9526404.1 DNA primase [Candidatus Dormibacteraeota bacterium]
MPADAVAEIKSRLDIVEVIGGYVALQRHGREFTGLCPFHAEKTPSFTVSQERQAWYCFGCQEGGDLFTFVERIEHVDFRPALEMLAERAGVELERSGEGGRGSGRRRKRALELNARAQLYYAHVLWAADAGKPGRDLLAERGVDDAVARRFGIGFAPTGGAAGDALVRYLTAKGGASAEELLDAGLAQRARGGLRDRFRNRLLFPIRDERGATLGFGGRAMGDAMPKYLNTSDTAAFHKSAAVYGLDLAREAMAHERSAVVVEGYFDVIAAHSAGVENTVASSGTALTREQVRVIARHAASLTLCFDGDDAGRAAASRAIDVIAAEGLAARICRLPRQYKDPDEMVRSDPAGFASAVASAQPEWQVLLDHALGGAEGGNVDARRGAAERAVAVLMRIPEAATRELYLQQAARRLDIGQQSLASDLGRALRDGTRQRARVVLAPPQNVPEKSDEAEVDDADGAALPEWEAYLGSIVVHRPALAHTLTDTMGLDVDELTHPTVRRIVRVALDVDDEVNAFPLHRLTTADQRRAAMLLVRDMPVLADDVEPPLLARAMADCVRDVHEATVVRSMAEIRNELHRAKEDGRDDEVQLLATRLSELATQAPRLRGTLSRR